VHVLTTLNLDSSAIVLRRAAPADLPAIMDLLAADQIGTARDGVRTDADLQAYRRAFGEIDRDPAHVLVVAETEGRIVGTMQLSYIPGLSHRGALRAQIEAVRVHQDYRGRGFGHAMLTWAISQARQRGCALVQLTTNKSRVDAHRFYKRLGFTASHEGMKLPLH
jgi:GNAT superfamily N-acetyltransferase